MDWQRLSPHLDRLFELEAAECEGYLHDLTLADPVAARALRELLAERNSLEERGFLRGVLSDRLDLMPHALESGVRVGAYTLDSLLGRGGMGEVWRASRSDGQFEGYCAIKFLDRSGALVKAGADRFRSEGRLLARLAHPNIARLLDAGTTEGEQPYLVLEYVEGERIDDYCSQASLGVRERVRLFLEVVGAVAHAHANLIIHRDLKPPNVLVTRAGAVKLLDFGIAKLLSSEIVEDAATTRVEEAALTPEYAAPEQLLGEVPSTATDVYQLGMLLYVLLTGRHPLQISGSRAERIKTALEERIPRAAEFASGPVRKQLRGDLESILSKALRRDPRERYATAAAFHDDLERYLQHEPVSARRGAALYLARKFVERHRASVAAGAVVALTLMGAYATTRMELFEARKQREAALASARRAEATKDFLELVLSEFQSRGEVLTTRRLLERSSQLLKAQYADRPDFVSEMLIELATSYNDLLDINTARRLLTDARGIAHAQSNNRLLASAECALAILEVHNESPEAGKEHLDLGLQALHTVPADDATVRTTCMGAQATLVDVRGDRARAIEIERQARKMLEEAGATRSAAYSEVLSDLASYLMEDGRVAEALPVLQLSMSNHEANGRRGTRIELIAEQNVSVALYRLGEVRAAYEIQSRLFDRMMQLKSPGDMDFANVVGTATHANRLRIRVLAQSMLGEAVARAEQEGDLQGFDYASVELARFRLQTGAPRSDVEAPLEHLEAAHADKRIPLGLRLMVLIESVRAELDLRDTRFASADDRARKLLATLNDAKFIRPQSNYMAYLLEAKTALAVRDTARAMADARAALRIVEPIARGAGTSADIGEALLLLARGLVARGNMREARPLLERAVNSLTRGYSADHPVTAAAVSLLEESSLAAEG